MRNINILVYLNRFAVVITALLYITVVYGMIAQLFLGIFHIITAIGLLTFWSKLTVKHKRLLLTYWLIVGLYTLLVTNGVLFFSTWNWIGIIVFPLLIAFYFTYFLESIRTKRRNVFSLTETN